MRIDCSLYDHLSSYLRRDLTSTFIGQISKRFRGTVTALGALATVSCLSLPFLSSIYGFRSVSVLAVLIVITVVFVLFIPISHLQHVEGLKTVPGLGELDSKSCRNKMLRESVLGTALLAPLVWVASLTPWLGFPVYFLLPILLIALLVSEAQRDKLVRNTPKSTHMEILLIKSLLASYDSAVERYHFHLDSEDTRGVVFVEKDSFRNSLLDLEHQLYERMAAADHSIDYAKRFGMVEPTHDSSIAGLVATTRSSDETLERLRAEVNVMNEVKSDLEKL